MSACQNDLNRFHIAADKADSGTAEEGWVEITAHAHRLLDRCVLILTESSILLLSLILKRFLTMAPHT